MAHNATTAINSRFTIQLQRSSAVWIFVHLLRAKITPFFNWSAKSFCQCAQLLAGRVTNPLKGEILRRNFHLALQPDHHDIAIVQWSSCRWLTCKERLLVLGAVGALTPTAPLIKTAHRPPFSEQQRVFFIYCVYKCINPSKWGVGATKYAACGQFSW